MVFGFLNTSRRSLPQNFATSETTSIMGEKTGFVTPNSSRSPSPVRPALVINTAAKQKSPQRPPSPPLTASPSGDETIQNHMDNYKNSVQNTLATLGVTVTVLGEQASKYSDLGPAIDAAQKVRLNPYIRYSCSYHHSLIARRIQQRSKCPV